MPESEALSGSLYIYARLKRQTSRGINKLYRGKAYDFGKCLKSAASGSGRQAERANSIMTIAYTLFEYLNTVLSFGKTTCGCALDVQRFEVREGR